VKKWQPPIPAGALCSPDGIAINSALPLLGWCYDQVGRDGWLRINLHEVAGEIDVPYHTVRKWWNALEASSFIAEVDKRGRNGMSVRLADRWLDWRSRDAQSAPNPVPNTTNRNGNGTQMGPEQVPNTAIRNLIGTETAPNPVPNVPAYKVLKTPDQAESVRGIVNEGEDRDGTARALAHPALNILAEYFPSTTLDAKQVKSICSTATDGTVWRSVVELFAQNGWQPLVGNLLDRYRKALEAKAKQPQPAAPRTVSAPAYKRPEGVLSTDELRAELTKRKGASS
jgi:hypothetical protein